MGMYLKKEPASSILMEVNHPLDEKFDLHQDNLLFCNGEQVTIGGEFSNRILFYRDEKNEQRLLLVPDVAIDCILSVADGKMIECRILLESGEEVIFCRK